MAVIFFGVAFVGTATRTTAIPAALTNASRLGRLPMRCVRGRPGASCWGEPVARRALRAKAVVSGARPLARRMPCRQPRVPTMLGEALAGELVCVPKVLVVASLQITIASGCHLASPALYIDGLAKIGEVESRAIRSVTTIFKIVERASSMQLQENDVTGL